jgi:Transcription elongation factor, GreA/GreB, C-term
MSRAFVKETAPSAPPPERMVEDGPNLVTPEGLAQIEGHVARIEDAIAAEANPLLRETLARDLRYWVHQRATAQVVGRPLRLEAEDAAPPSPGPSSTDRPLPSRERVEIAFGSRVVIARKGRKQSFRIVGVDEAEPAKGLISFRAPLAAAIIGARAGDIVEAAEPLGEIAIVDVEG